LGSEGAESWYRMFLPWNIEKDSLLDFESGHLF
jgi:hypothetical protein